LYLNVELFNPLSMKKIKWSVVILTLLTLQCFAQEGAGNNSILNIKIMPLSVLDGNPRYRLGLEFISDLNLGVGIDFGVGSSSLNKWRLGKGGWGKEYQLYEIRPEIKYLVQRKEDYYFYVATEFFFIRMRNVLESGSYHKEHTNYETRYDWANFSKQKYGAHLKGGVAIKFSTKFDLDIYAGIGAAKRKITYQDVINPIENPDPIFVEWLPQPHLFEGESRLLHLSMGIKIGYRLWTNKDSSIDL
jgi:hypothetical protein